MEPLHIYIYIYDLDRDEINDLDKFLKKPHSVVLSWCNLLLFYYSYLKILKLKIYCSSLFGHVFLCPCYLMTRFCYLNHSCFFSLSFSTQNPQFLPLVSLKSPLNWSNIWKSLLLQINNKIVKRGNFATDIKIFTRKNLIISIVLILYLPIVNLLSLLSLLTPQNKFLDDLRL